MVLFDGLLPLWQAKVFGRVKGSVAELSRIPAFRACPVKRERKTNKRRCLSLKTEEVNDP